MADFGAMPTMPRSMSALFYQIEGVRKQLVIENPVLAHFRKFVQRRICQPESGGQLFGTFEEDTITIRVATGPYKEDKRTRYRFTPDRKREHKDIDAQFDLGLQFIGNWHTHPEQVPTPSYTDLSNTRERFLRSDHELLAFTMVIVGTAALPRGLGVVLVNGSGHVTLSPSNG